MPAANQLHDLNDRLDEFLASYGSDRPPEGGGDACGSAGGGWPVEMGDILVLDPTRPLALCTLGDPALAATMAALGHPALAVAGPTATENVGVEKLVRNVAANASIHTVLLVGPETGGTAPTGHFAGDALIALARNGVDPRTRRIIGAKGRRPFVRNVSLEEVYVFRGRVTVVDHRGLSEPADVSAALDESAGRIAAPTRPDAPDTGPAPDDPASAPDGAGRDAVEWVDASAAPGHRADPAGYFLVFADHENGRLVAEHYTNDDRRTVVIGGSEPRAIARAAVERGLLGSLEHAAYLGGELERAASALAEHRPYVQDGGDRVRPEG